MKKIVFIILLVLAIPFVFSGCTPRSKDYKEQKQTRFIIIERYKADISTNDYYIIVDKETKIMYLQFNRAYKGGITPLLDKNGNPQRYEGEL